MESSRKNSFLQIDKETFLILELIKNKFFSKFDKLMSEKEIKESINNGYFMGEPMPYPFVFLADGKNEKDIKKGANLDLLMDDEIVASIKVEGVFKDKGFYDRGIFSLVKEKTSGNSVCVCGDFEIYSNELKDSRNNIEQIKKELNTMKITAVMLTADPFNRAHERVVRMCIDKADLVVMFLLENTDNKSLEFGLRKESLEYFIQNYLPKNKAVIVPIKSKIFSSHQNPNLEYILAHNIGANKVVVGQNHNGIGMFFDNNQPNSILDKYKKDLNIETIILPELVYCNECRTIVSTKTCPHGQHHHIKYHSDILKTLLFKGIIPPTISMRSDISALILSKIFPNRFENLQKLCDELFANSGLLEVRNERDFYVELMRLYQTSSLT